MKMKNMIQIINFKVSGQKTYVLIEFEISTILPKDLKSIVPPDAVTNNFAHKGVILSGRGPIWLYGFLIHFYHPTLWVATYDPRLRGAVVVESHTSDIKAGDIIPMEVTQ
jgi:CRISPR-associated protein Csx3